MYKQKAKMKQREILKGSRGITLIALVITIIVLLILAAVSIATLKGENGILSQADKAGTETKVKSEEEQIELAYNAAKTNKLRNRNNEDVKEDELQKELDNQGVNAKVTKNSPLEVEFKDSKNSYIIDEETGKITLATTEKPEEFDESKYEGLENSTPIEQNRNKYGWKVNNYNVEYTQTNGNTSTVWRLFYQDEKYTYLIADGLVGSYKPSDYCDKEEDEEKYKDGTKMSTVGQKLNGRVSPLFTDETKKSQNNIRATVWFTDITNELWTKYKDTNGDAEFCIASPTAELFEASYNKNTNPTHDKYKGNILNVQLGTYGYKENTDDDWLRAEDSYGIYNKDDSSNWWLASPGNNGSSNNCLDVSGISRLFQRRQREQQRGCSSPYSLYSNI